jgi:hypothetical protein
MRGIETRTGYSRRTVVWACDAKLKENCRMYIRLVAVAIMTATLFGVISTTATPSFAMVVQPICPYVGPCCFDDFRSKCGRPWEIESSRAQT